jgi:hypothetical protein
LIGNQVFSNQTQVAQWSQIIPSDIRKDPISSGTVVSWTGYKPPAPFRLADYNVFSILAWPRSESDMAPNTGGIQKGDSGGMAIFCKPKTVGSKILVCSIMGMIEGMFSTRDSSYYSNILNLSSEFYQYIPKQ